MENLKIKPVYLKTYITAVKLYEDDYIFAGTGGNLKVYRWNSDGITKCTSLRIFECQTIHGIIFYGKDQCAVYGGKNICILQVIVTNDVINIVIEHTYQIQDWILQLRFFRNDILAVTAHNAVLLFDRVHGHEINHFDCNEKCILYCAEFIIDENKNVTESIVLGGTVFSEIIIWKTSTSREYNKVLHRLKGHKGVIFSIAFDIDLKLLTSTSDDRSLRIWRMNSTSKTNISDTFDWENLNITLQHTAFGHVDRVRSSIIIKELKIIISVGEDSFICIWTIDGNLISKKSSHQGGPIWTHEVDLKRQLIITGGSDGGLLLHELLPSVKEPLPLPINSFVGDNVNPRKVIYTSMNTLISITSNGSLIQYCKNRKHWFIIDQMKEMSSYCIIHCKFDRILACGLNGNIRIYQENEKNIVLREKQKLFEDRIVSGILTNNGFAICLESGVIHCYKILCNGLQKDDEFLIPNSNEPWFTAADDFKEYLIIGDRKGSIHLFIKGNPLPLCTIPKAHNHLGVTSISIRNGIVVSTGRDGKCLRYKIIDNNLMKLLDEKFDFKWIEKHIVVNKTEIFCGFISNKFILSTSTEIIWQINCGGGHRSWDMSICNDNVTFAFIKNNVVYETSCLLSDILKLKVEEGFIEKEINCLNSLNTTSTNCLFITGGEDTVLTVNNFSILESETTKLFRIQNHLSSIKDIKSLEIFNKNNVKSFIIISCGGRAQICVSEIGLDFSKSEPIYRTECLGNHMLNFDMLGKKYKSKNDDGQDSRYMNLCIVPNLKRDSYPKENLNILIATGCSDGILRIFNIMKVKSQYDIEFVAQGNNGNCILLVHSFTIDSDVRQHIILTMDTLGLLKMWNITFICNGFTRNTILNIIPEAQWKIHENGINSFDFKLISDHLFLLATGGDDNAIHLTLLKEFNKPFKIDKIYNWKNATAHCSQITGIVLYEQFLITASIDQKISTFHWHVNKNEVINCKYIKQYCSTIADIQGIKILRETSTGIMISVYGRGIELIEIDISDIS